MSLCQEHADFDKNQDYAINPFPCGRMYVEIKQEYVYS